MVSVRIGMREVGGTARIFIIAEAGVNHNGDERMAHDLIDAAAAAAADAVKFQTFDPAELVQGSAPKADYQRRTSGDGTQREMLDALALRTSVFRDLVAHARERGIMLLSTPFDLPSLQIVVDLELPAIKVSSGDLTSLPFLRAVGAARRPVILSTGMGDLTEVEAAMNALRNGGATDVVLLHCVSSYPAPENELNLRAMDTMRRRFRVPVGYSDHSEGSFAPIAAAAAGACLIEKHFTLDRSLPGPDHAASALPQELHKMIASIRRVEALLGNGDKLPTDHERDAIRNLRKSVVARRAVPAGTRLRPEDLTIKRPGDGIAPGRISEIVGRRARSDLAADSTIRWEDLD